MLTFKRSRHFGQLLAASLLFAPATVGWADNITWDANNTTGNQAWLNGINWSPDTVPGATDVAVFDNTLGSGIIEITLSTSSTTNNGTSSQIVGAISLTGGESKVIQNGSGSADGTLTLAGVGGVLLSNTSSNLALTVQNGTSRLMNLTLGASGTINVSSATITIGSAIGETGGPRSITKTGAGTLILSGENTYSGNTSINGGTLLLSTIGNNNISSSPRLTIGSTATLNVSNVTGAGGFKIGANQTLAGTGNVEGAVTADVSTATVMPGDTDSPGNLTLRSNFTLSSGKLAVESNASSFSLLTVSGAVTLGGTLQLKASYQPPLNTPITILNKTSSGAISSAFSGLAENTYFHPNSGFTDDWYKISYLGGTGNDIVISRAAVPEPGTLALLALATSSLLRRRRRHV